MKRKVDCGQLSVEITSLGLLHIVKAASETWPNTRVSSFQREFFSAERLMSCQTWISRSPVTARINLVSDLSYVCKYHYAEDWFYRTEKTKFRVQSFLHTGSEMIHLLWIINLNKKFSRSSRPVFLIFFCEIHKKTLALDSLSNKVAS